ncbi:MAG: tetratricopeptide repeat protein [Candidatus Brocadiia bacterium]
MRRDAWTGTCRALVAAAVVLAGAAGAGRAGAADPGEGGEGQALSPERQQAEALLERYRRDKRVREDQKRFLATQHLAAGKANFDMGEFREALRHFQKAVELAPELEEAQEYVRKAKSLLNLEERRVGDLAGVYAAQRKIAIEVQETELRNMFERAKRLFEQEHYQEAVEAFTRVAGKARFLSPKIDVGEIAEEAEVYIQRSLAGIEEKQEQMAARRREKAEEATAQLRKEREKLLDERVEALYRQAKVLFEQHRYEEARKVCDEILLKDPTNGAAEALREAAIKAAHDEQIEHAINARRVETERHWDETRAMTVPQSELVYMPREQFEEVRSRLEEAVIGEAVEKREPWEAKIREAMEKKISFDFVETPLQDVITFISSLAEVTIVLDQKVIQDEPHPITLRVKDMRLKSALDWVLRLAGLTYTLRNEAVFVSKPEHIHEKPVLRMYDVTDLTIDIKNFQGRQQALASDGGYSSTGSSGGGYGGQDSVGEDFFGDEDDEEDEDHLTGESLVEFIKKTIARGTWADDTEIQPF